MAIATEMTLALGRTVYGGDPSGDDESDERIEGREVRISVTWRLTDREQDLTVMTSALAEEAERALSEAERTARKGSRKCPGTETNAVRLPAQDQPPAPHGGNGTGPAPGFDGRSSGNGYPAGTARYGSQAPTANGTNGASRPPAYVPSISKAQQLAVQSYCTRHGVPDWELRRLVWERFGKKETRELNKEEGGELLAALQQGPPFNGPDQNKDQGQAGDRQWPGNPAYAN